MVVSSHLGTSKQILSLLEEQSVFLTAVSSLQTLVITVKNSEPLLVGLTLGRA